MRLIKFAVISVGRRIARRLIAFGGGSSPAGKLADADIVFLREGGHFDQSWYLKAYPDVAKAGVDPVVHYVVSGASEKRSPCGDFDPVRYARQHLDVATDGIQLFRHYVEHGLQPIANASPTTLNERESADAEVIERSGIFDEQAYIATSLQAGHTISEAIAHYIKVGTKISLNPCALFDTHYYLKRYPDVAKSGTNPFAHFCRSGFKELRNPCAQFDTAWYSLVHMSGNISRENPLLHYKRLGRIAGFSTRPSAPMLPSEHQQLRDACDVVCEVAEGEADVFTRLGESLAARKATQQAEQMYRRALVSQRGNAEIHARLGMCLTHQRKWWQAVGSWQEAVSGNGSNATWWGRLGEALEHMGRFQEASDAFGRASTLDPKVGSWFYHKGTCLEQIGDARAATAAYAAAIRVSSNPEAAKFGIGVLHQAHGAWTKAAAAYAGELGRQPLDPELNYRVGMACDRLYDWNSAKKYYGRALSLEPNVHSYWHYRYGFVLERMKDWDGAALAYAAAIRLTDKAKPYWHYRRGFVLAEAGRYPEACLEHIAQRKRATLDGKPYMQPLAGLPDRDGQDVQNPLDSPSPLSSAVRSALASSSRSKSPDEAFEGYMQGLSDRALEMLKEVISSDFTSLPFRTQLGNYLESKQSWAAAADAYADAVQRSTDYNPALYYRLGFTLFQAGKYNEACAAFRQTRITQQASGVDVATMAKSYPSEVLPTTYVTYRENLPIAENVILYESHIGKQVSCNPLALFEYLTKHPDYQHLLHVWVVNEQDRIPDAIRRCQNVVIAPRPSDLYLRYLASAKYLVNNTVFPQYFVRREGQRFLATWHGTPLKTLGKQQQYKFQDHKRAQRNFLQATHIISPNAHTTGVLLDSYDIRDIMPGKLAETGYPRIDLTLNASEARKKRILAQLGVRGDRPVVLYAPTWRGTLETVSYEVEKAKADLALLAERHDCDIVFRGHHLMEKVFGADEAMGCVVAPPTIDTNELLSVVDVLITDYSSIFFDFLPTGRPVLYYIYDLEEYSRERGMYFSMDEMPGYKCQDIEALSAALEQALAGNLPDEAHRETAQAQFNAHDDGHATERVVEFFFHDATECVVDTGGRARKQVLVHAGGFQANGITTSFLNLAKHVDPGLVHLTVPIDSGHMEFDRKARALFSRVSENVAVVSRHGTTPMTWEERWLRAKYEGGASAFTEQQMTIVKRIFAREYARVFGLTHFDAIVTFSGYDPFWACLLNLGGHATRKSIYLHSDLRDEYETRFPELMRMFRVYGHADSLVCVCEQSREQNVHKLAEWLRIPENHFVVSENVQDPERMLALAEEALDSPDAELFEEGPVFATMGRLSVEKDQAKLIRSFGRFAKENATGKLLILGDGPLRGELDALIETLGLNGRVHLLGFRENPYPILRRSDCFVLSSNHEAKTMSLMEAIILGLPFIATDISGNADVKALLPEYFVENSETGLLNGMHQFMEGNLPHPKFDWRKHQALALGQFYSRVVGIDESVVASS